MPMSKNRLNRAMTGLRPGDVLANLNCRGCQDRKILVLARVGDDRYDFSMRADEINIVRDHEGPWRWNDHDFVFRNAGGKTHDHIGAEIELLEGAGLRELSWYRELPNPNLVRFRIDPRNALGAFQDPGTVAKLEAIINRSNDDVGFTRDLQQAIELLFAGSVEALDERRMRYLLTLIHSVAPRLGRSRSGIEDILGDAFPGSGIPRMPPMLREVLSGLHSRRHRERGGEGMRGNDRDHASASGD